MNAVAKIEEQKPKGVLATIASRYSMEPDVFKATVKGTVFPPTGTNEEFIAFLMVANEYRLNPITREIYAFPKKGGGIVPIVSIDGWVSLVNSHPQFDGMEFDFDQNDKGDLVSVTCRIYRKDRSRPVMVTEFLDECIRPTEPWKMKRRMLRHKSLMQCARYAFGFSGIYDDDEARDIAESARDITPPTPPAPPPPPAKTNAISDGEIIPPKRDMPKQPAPILPGDPDSTIGKKEEHSKAAAEDIPAEPDRAEDPNEIIAEVIDLLSMAQTEEAIEEGYEVADFEARLTAFDGYVERARAVKKQHIERVRKAEAPPAPPAADGLADDPPAPPPPADAPRPMANAQDYYDYAMTYVAKMTDSAKIKAWWSDTQETRAKLQVSDKQRLEIRTALNARMEALDAESR